MGERERECETKKKAEKTENLDVHGFYTRLCRGRKHAFTCTMYVCMYIVVRARSPPPHALDADTGLGVQHNTRVHVLYECVRKDIVAPRMFCGSRCLV